MTELRTVDPTTILIPIFLGTNQESEQRPSLGFHRWETASIMTRRAAAPVVREASRKEEHADEGRVRTLLGGLIDVSPCAKGQQEGRGKFALQVVTHLVKPLLTALRSGSRGRGSSETALALCLEGSNEPIL